MKRRFVYITGLACLFSLSSCGNIYDLIFGGQHFDGTVSEIERAGYSGITYNDVGRQEYYSYGLETPRMPSLGRVRALVVPVEFSDYPFSDAELGDLGLAFNDDEPPYFESVSSYYRKSSYGKLELAFDIAYPYVVGESSTAFLPAYLGETSSYSKIEDLCLEAYAEAIKDRDPSVYDSDGDGFVDGVYFIYSSPNYQNAASSYQNVNPAYWAFTTVATAGRSSFDYPFSNYFWASVDFVYEAWGRESLAPSGCTDAHTYIHETGHMMGLDDYYNYEAGEDSAFDNGSPMGGLDMMDYNIGDHDSWSKFALGWVDPYIVDDRYEFPISFELGSATATGDCLILPADGSYNGTAFDEYIVVELLTMEGVALTDARTPYTSNIRYFSEPGIRIMHVDSRLVGLSPAGGDQYYVSYRDVDKSMLSNASREEFYSVAASNTPGSSLYDPEYKLISTISSDPLRVFDQNNFAAGNSDLFQPGDTFTVGSYYRNFLYDSGQRIYLMNSGAEFPFSIKIESLSGGKAVVTVDLV